MITFGLDVRPTADGGLIVIGDERKVRNALPHIVRSLDRDQYPVAELLATGRGLCGKGCFFSQAPRGRIVEIRFAPSGALAAVPRYLPAAPSGSGAARMAPASAAGAGAATKKAQP